MKTENKIRIGAYCFMTMLFWFSNYAFVPVLSTYAGVLSTSKVLIGVMLGSYGWAQLALRIPIGVISDRYNNRRIFIRAGCIISFASALGLFFAPNIYWLIVCRTLNGVSAAVWVVMSVFFNSYFEGNNSVNALTLLNGCNYFGQIFASVAAMFLTSKYSMRSTFLVAAIAAALAAAISFFLKDKKMEREPLSYKILFDVGKNEWVLTLGIMCLLSQMMNFATTNGFTPQLALALGADTGMLPWIMLLSTMGGMIFSMMAPKTLIKKIGARNSLISFLLLQSVTTILQPLMPTLTTLFFMVFINGIARGTSLSLMLGLVVLPFPYEKQSAAMGFYQALYSIGIILGPTLAGAVMELSSIGTAFFVCGAVGLVAPILGLFFLNDERNKLPLYGN